MARKSTEYTVVSYLHITATDTIIPFEEATPEQRMTLCRNIEEVLSGIRSSQAMSKDEKEREALIKVLKNSPENKRKDNAVRKMIKALEEMNRYAEEHPEFYDEMLAPYDD